MNTAKINCIIALLSIGLLALFTNQALSWKVDLGVVTIKSKHKTPAHTAVAKAEEAVDIAKKEKEKVADKWNRWREENLDKVGDEISDEYKKAAKKFKAAAEKLKILIETIINIIKNSEEFPGPLENTRVLIPDPDISIEIERSFIQALISEVLEVPIDYDEIPNNNNYLQLRHPNISFLHDRNIIEVKVSDGVAGFDGFLSGGLKVNGATVEFGPKIVKRDKKVFIEMHAKMTYIDIKDSGEETDKIFANAVQELAFNKGPILIEDITDDITIRDSISLGDFQREILIQPDVVTVYLDADKLIIRAKFKKTAEGNNEN